MLLRLTPSVAAFPGESKSSASNTHTAKNRARDQEMSRPSLFASTAGPGAKKHGFRLQFEHRYFPKFSPTSINQNVFEESTVCKADERQVQKSNILT